MIDAVSGTIYVLGGVYGSTYFNDVLKSADGGADRTRRLMHEGGPRATWVLEGHCGGTLVVPVGVVEAHSVECLAVLPVPQGHETGTQRDTQGYLPYSVVLRGLRRLRGTRVISDPNATTQPRAQSI